MDVSKETRVFVSHYHNDAAALGKMKKYLSDYGVSFFLAHMDINPGEHDLKRIKTEIKDCDIFLFIGNKQSKESIYCNQEIGMALGYDKKIISTLDKKLKSSWGFIERNQAIKYTDIDDDLSRELLKQFAVYSNNESYLHSKSSGIKYLSDKNIQGFRVSDKEVNNDDQYIQLISNKWNDYGYTTSFEIYLEKNIGSVKIGHDSMPDADKHYSQYYRSSFYLPKKFFFLSEKFFSYVDFSNDVDERLKATINLLLNNIVTNYSLAKRYINRGVMTHSLFRYREGELDNLKSEVKKLEKKGRI